MSPQIVDSTLREGTQAPGVHFTAHQAVEIAHLLSNVGIDVLEVGHPAASLEQMNIVKRIAQLGVLPVLAHARSDEKDITIVKRTGATWVGLFLGINHETRTARVLGWSVKKILNQIQNAVLHAKRLGLKVRYTVEDASRTNDKLLLQAYRVAIEAGAECICLSDTVGIMEPAEVAKKVELLKKNFPEVALEVHFHNDRGLAMANALAAVDAGVDRISTSVNGLGERAGITDTLGLLVNLHFQNIRQASPPNIIRELGTRVAAYARTPLSPNHPITGYNVFTHTAHLHQKAIQLNPHSYTWIDPQKVGMSNKLATQKLSDCHSLFLSPFIKCASELRYHRSGYGTRYVMLDERMVPDCRQYCIVREIPATKGTPIPHVDSHVHKVDSLFLFLGKGPGLSGLKIEVTVGKVVRQLDSPASVFIPAGLSHTYRILSGSGVFINHVLSGSYNDSLLEPLPKLCNNNFIAA